MTRTVREHDMVGSGDLVLVQVSGGPDSVCLLHSMWRLRRLLGIRLAAFHYDHRLREDSAGDAAYARRQAARLGIPFHLGVASDSPRKGTSVEAWATVARGNAANDVRRAIGAAVMVEGHTLDDQVETVLLNLIRGGGLEALSGIWPGSRASALAQPLLDVTRAEVEAFCRALRLRPRRDPMNEDRAYLRNAIRHEVLPEIQRATGRDPRGPISRSAALLRESRLELSAAAVAELSRVVSGPRDAPRFDAEALTSLPRAVASRVVRLAVFHVLTLEDAPWTKDAVDAVLDLAAGRPGRRRDLPGGLLARRDRVYVSVSRTSPESRV